MSHAADRLIVKDVSRFALQLNKDGQEYDEERVEVERPIYI